MMRRVIALLIAPLWAASAQAGRAMTVTPVNAAALKRDIAGHRGHVVLVNFWATWCPPCMKEFPGLVRLDQRYGNKGLIILAVSGDKPRDIPSRISPFLVRQKAAFPQFVINGDLDTFVDQFQPKWQADFPQTFIFDKKGRLVRELRDPQTEATWFKAIAPFLRRR